MDQLIKALPGVLHAAGDSEDVAEAAAIAVWKHVAGDGLRPHAVPLRLHNKTLMVAVADSVWQKQLESMLVLGADTVVVIEGEILGQPRDADDARRMLRLLSGKWHEVLTGVALVRAGAEADCIVDQETTRVRFSQMSDTEIDWYVRTGEPMGKAGAYAVQGYAALFIEEIQGEYFNVVGLPVRLLYKLAREL